MRSSLQEHATEVQWLVGLVFAELPGDYRRRMALDTFCNSWPWTFPPWSQPPVLGIISANLDIRCVDDPTGDGPTVTVVTSPKISPYLNSRPYGGNEEND